MDAVGFPPAGGAGGEFVCEPLTPVAGTGDARAMARGEPGLPARFLWRGRECAVTAVLGQWKTSSPERGRPDAEVYLRRHWYRVALSTGETLTIYCDRQARAGRPKARWWVYTVEAR